MADEDKRVLKDSGTRQVFATGAVRDLQEGKGRYDLMPMRTLWDIVTDTFVPNYQTEKPAGFLKRAMLLTIEAMTNPDVAENMALSAGKEMLHYMEAIYRNGLVPPGQGERIIDWPTHGLFRVARVYEKGAIKYAPRNWEKGINLARFLDSAFRHMLQTAEGKFDEDHPAQACWNLLSFVETKYWISLGFLPQTLNDLPVRNRPKPIEGTPPKAVSQ